MELATNSLAGEVWRDCASWLTRCEVLRPDHKANWADASVSDLAYTLRDGVLLCNLLNGLEPGCIEMKDVNQKPQMAQFLCLRNIKAFLQVCHDHFGLKKNELFEPSMLFDLSDFFRVLHTLSKLSNSPRIQRKNIPGFSFKPRTLSQEDIYRNLHANVETPSDPDITPAWETWRTVPWLQFTIPCPKFGEVEEELYEDLFYVTFTNEVPCPITHSLEKRDYVINELVETEKKYVDVLSTLQRSFMRPLGLIIKEEDMKIVFHGIKELSEIHAGFHSQLRKACTPQSTLRLSEVFINWREKFLIYGDYCANLTGAQNLIQELCTKDNTINQEVIRCQQDANNGKFKLRDILSVPMQRILKYHLLLDKLISETQHNHDDFRGLERAKEAMVDVAQYCNEVKRDSDTLQIMHDIQESISDWVMPEDTELKDYGRLLKDGELRIKAHNDQKVKVRYVFIFDQVMLMCKSVRGDQYSFKESLPLREYKVEDVTNRRVLHQSSRWSYQWLLVRKSERTAFTMYARTEDQKRKWIKAIQDALDNIEPAVCRNTDHRFQMTTFEKPTTCNHCSKFLKGRIFQGYRCERCLIACHKPCIPFAGRCGMKPPPELPPRPPLLSPRHDSDPNAINHTIQLPQPLPLVAEGSRRSWTHDMDLLKEYLWFVGEMGRDQASSLLEQTADGTYLLRIRPQGPTHPNETAYALSMKADNEVKHMKVYEKEIDNIPHYYLSESRFFRSVVELISCYEHTSLAENFSGLHVKLRWPFRRIVVVAELDYDPTEPNQLPLKKGAQVVVLSKEADHMGWWKGKVNDRVGFFPKVYVREISETFNLE
ncbi:protein vav [Thrips palmi]|uniref:Protein vav n=1 Tax=Thrips palmi TaxID=161013 RepID=A0A6P8YAC5_THRPL|nr:protein vav [Thrips palmi]